MKKTHLFRTIIIALSFGLMISMCACGNTGTGAESSEASSKVELTAEQQVEKLLLEEFEEMYGDDMELCEFKEIKIFTAEEIAENKEMFQDCHFEETDIVFSASYDLKAPDGKDIAPLLPANGEEDGQWVRDKYVCGYLSLVSEGAYKLADWGTAF